MKRLLILPALLTLLGFATSSQAKLSDDSAMKCISQDRLTKSAFLDLEQAYEMRSVSAKDFFQAFDKSANCPQLRKNLQKLHGDMISKLPVPAPKGPSHAEPAESSGPQDESTPTFLE